ncbi:MAG: putative phage tail protein, partial [Pseudomonadota bacterium]
MTSLPDISRYATALSRIFARGGCWPEAGGANWMSLMRAFAHEFRRTDLRLLQLIEEADPRTCSETLEDWERVYGLPDPCAPENVTIEERRAALLALIRAKGGSSIPFFTELARELGYGVEIVEHRPFVFGRSPFGYQKTKQQMGSPLMRYVWTVKMKTPRARWFRFGVGGGRFGQDPHLSIERATHVECAFRRRKPSHTEIVFSYEHEIDVPGLAA